MRPYETHPFSRLIDLIVINRPLLTNFSPLGARYFGLHALYAPFSISILRSSASPVFYTFLTSFSAYLATFSRASSSRATAYLIIFSIFFFIISRIFSSSVIAYCNFLSTAARYR
jgi:hypothetical protein